MGLLQGTIWGWIDSLFSLGRATLVREATLVPNKSISFIHVFSTHKEGRLPFHGAKSHANTSIFFLAKSKTLEVKKNQPAKSDTDDLVIT